jgi:hypothetical protein
VVARQTKAAIRPPDAIPASRRPSLTVEKPRSTVSRLTLARVFP